MKRGLKQFISSVLIAGCLGISSIGAVAQFSPAVLVNDGVITEFEVNQRVLMLQAFGSSGELRQVAIDGLIDDRLRQQAASVLGISVDEGQIAEGMAEFAARGNLNTEQLLQYLSQRRVEEETFRDFVSAGLLFREVVRARFGRSSVVTDEEVDRRIALRSSENLSILMAEIIIPTAERGDAKTKELANQLSNTISSQGAFASSARRYSRSASARNGGRLDWLPVSNLPPQLSGQLLALETNEVSAPITLQNAIGIFQLRGVRSEASDSLPLIGLSYVQVPIPANANESQIARITSRSDTCADIRAEAEIFGDDAHRDHSLSPSEVPLAIAGALAQLDPNETIVTQTGDTRSILMLCERLRDLPEGERDNIREALFNQRIGGFGDGYLKELKGKAFISIQ